MNNEVTALFRGIGEDLKHQGELNQKQTRACLKVMNGIIAPVINHAIDEIGQKHRITHVYYGVGIQVLESLSSAHYSMTFACRGDTVDIITREGDHSNPVSVKIGDVTEILIGEQIALFLRKALNLSSSNDLS